MWDARFDPVTGALRSLVDGGELQIIRNSHLRRALAGWVDRTEESRLTSASWDGQRHNLLPLVLSFPSDRPLSLRQRSTVFILSESIAGQSPQLEALTERIEEILTMIEGELDR